MKPRVVLTHWVHPEVEALLEQNCTIVTNPSRESLPTEQLLERAATADALMVFMPDRIDAGFLQACPQLKIIAAALKGYDNFDVPACTQQGVWFTIVQEALTQPTAELALALMLGVARNVQAGDRVVRSGAFKGWRPIFYGQGLQGATVGILGMGAIGKALAQMLGAFDCSLLCTNRSAVPQQTLERLRLTSVDVAELYQRSDLLVVTVPYTLETQHMIDTPQLAQMKTGAYLINVGRGSVINEQAVAAALKQGQLAGYAADVFEFEDWARPDRPLSICPELLDPELNTLFTPHLGSAVDAIRKQIALEAARNILQALQGEVPMGAINRPSAADGVLRRVD